MDGRTQRVQFCLISIVYPSLSVAMVSMPCQGINVYRIYDAIVNLLELTLVKYFWGV